MTSTSPLLPILERREEIVGAIRHHQVVIVCGETGSGKTTQLPQMCLAMGLPGVVGHTQPRRLAARAVAARIAEERGEALGDVVGVKIRFHDQTSRRTRIKVMTDGILLAELGADARLGGYGTIIIDEAHERSLNIDFLLGYLRRLLPQRPDLKVIVTSATIDPGKFSSYFGGPSVAPVIEVSGRTYPVEVRYSPYRDDQDDPERIEVEAVADAVEDLRIGGSTGGDCLVFLPGEREIRMAADALRRRRLDAEVLPLFSRLTNQEQDRIFHPSGRRRVILATNVAETSLTVPGIRYVVDTGLARISRYDPARKIQRLPVEPVSRASANQRAGRCGRVEAGVCVRLYSEGSYAGRTAFTDPEIRRTNLANVILQMKALRLGPIEGFPFLDNPDAAAIKDGYETLFELGAIDAATSAGRLTEIGTKMSRLPVDPRVARMLLAADGEGSLNEVVILAAVLSIQDPRERPLSKQEESDRAQTVFRHESSDFLTLLRVWDQYSHAAEHRSHGELIGWCREHFLSAARMREWGELARQLRGVAEEMELRFNPGNAPASEDAIHRALLTGLITNVACREAEGGSFDYRGVRGNTVQIFPGSVLFKKGPKWMMAAEIVQTTRLYARTVAKVDPEWIEELAGHMFRHQLSDQHLDPQTGEPSAWERVTMSGIVVVPRRRAAIAKVDPKAARQIFIREALVRGKWETDEPAIVHNREVIARAKRAEAKVRRRDVMRGEDELAEWFEKRVPAEVVDPASFAAWLKRAEEADRRAGRWSIEDVVLPGAARAFDEVAFPDEIEWADDAAMARGAVSYAFAAGKEEDGVTVTVPLALLPVITAERAEWLVPGMLADVIAALIKTLPKAQRALIEAQGDVATLAAACAEVMVFGEGSLAAALSDAVQVLYGVGIPAEPWSFKGLPAHLRLRVRVVDEAGKELAADREVAALLQRFEAKLRKLRAARERATIERHGLVSWDFGSLPMQVEVEREGKPVTVYPTLMDRGGSVSLTLVESAEEAAAATSQGLRRLYALACAEEVRYYIDALPGWQEMAKQYAQLGSAEDLRRDLTCLIAEWVFMDGQAMPRTKAEFDERLASNWGRLAVAARDVGEVVARILEPRHKVAQRLSGGTPRIWADSVADLREHAAYLMPRGFLLLVPWERLKRYPTYVGLMRERLFALREEGSRAETEAIAQFSPHWKKFTAWVAAAMSVRAAAVRAAVDDAGGARPATSSSTKHRAPLPPTRRTGPTLNLDAAEWAMEPAHLPAAVRSYRWALEEFRVAVFAPQLASKPVVSRAEVEGLAARLPAPGAAL